MGKSASDIGKRPDDSVVLTHLHTPPDAPNSVYGVDPGGLSEPGGVPPSPAGVSDQQRDTWGGQLEFLLTCVGFAVGLGNVWRFPYLCYQNGGGAFLIPYVIMLVFIGIPLFYLEVSFGQFASLGPIAIWSASPIFKGVGYAMVIVAALVSLYYNVIIAWCLYYLFASMTSRLPWTSCDNWWNTEACIDVHSNVTNITSSNLTLKTPSEEYFYNQVLRKSDGMHEMGGVVWHLALCLLLTWVVVFVVLIKGIASLGKAAYFMSLFPYVLLTAMLIRGVTLEGSYEGILFYIRPDFSRLTDLKVWSDAATQIFYSLGCCMGGLIAMSSFNNFKNNILRDALIIPLVNCGTSLYAGFVIFSVLGYMAREKGVPVSEVAASGPGLVFVVYPEGLSTMPIAPLWAVLFFLMMIILGFSSQFSTIEGIASAIIDEYPSVMSCGRYGPVLLRLALCSVFFLCGLPLVTRGGFYLFGILNDYAASFPLVILGFVEVVAIAFVYGYRRFAEDISMMLGSQPSVYWRICWCGLTPLILMGTFTMKVLLHVPLSGGVYPPWAPLIAWSVTACPLIVMVLVSCRQFATAGACASLRRCAAPSDNWGPAKFADRSGRYRKDAAHLTETMQTIIGRDNLAFTETAEVVRRCKDKHNVETSLKLRMSE